MSEIRSDIISLGSIEFSKRHKIYETPLSTVFVGKFNKKIDVAVKRFPLNLAKFARIENDRLLLQIDHTNVVKCYCEAEDDDFCYIAMELCPCNLEEYIEKNEIYSRLPSTPSEEIIRGAAEGIAHIHKKDMIHRDIKPSNILLFVKENQLVAKISDFSISRIIPARHTSIANFSAGTDLYKAPELLTPLFSWRSDVYAFGLVVFYVLSNGKHLFGGDRFNIIHGFPTYGVDLKIKPAAASLIERLTILDQKARPRMSEVVHHPFFWDDEKKLNFIRDVHQVTEDKQNAFLKDVIEEDSHEVICSSPTNCGNKRLSPNPTECADWTVSITPKVKADLNCKVKHNSCAELVRIMRNKLTHFYDLRFDVKAEYGGSIDNLRRYWMQRFPFLVSHLWDKLETTYAAQLLNSYYAPESVRREKVQNDVHWDIDEGKIGEPQELFNRVRRLNRTSRDLAFYLLIQTGKKEHFEVFIRDGTVPDIASVYLYGKTLLHEAACYGQVEIAQLLIKSGAEINCRNCAGDIPLHEAVQNGHLELAQLLITSGAEISCKSLFEKTPLHLAAENGRLDLAQLLIQSGAEINCEAMYGKTPLHLAAENGRLELARLLLKTGAEINCKATYGSTPLHFAAEKDHLEVAQLLIKSGAEVNSRTTDGRTPLHSAAEDGHLEVSQLLLKSGAEIHCKDAHGSTPLNRATMRFRTEVVRLLQNALLELGLSM